MDKRQLEYAHRAMAYHNAQVRAMDYRTEYLYSEHWARKKRLKLTASNYTCQRCGSRSNLDVHHLTYERLGHELLRDLVVLCRTCHERV